jgi:hypothetical protein
MYEATSRFTVGYYWKGKDWKNLWERNYSNIRPCPATYLHQDFCQPFVGRFSDLVFIHDNFHSRNFSTYDSLINTAPQFVHWYLRFGFPRLCVMRNPIWPPWSDANVPAAVRQKDTAAIVVQKFVDLHVGRATRAEARRQLALKAARQNKPWEDKAQHNKTQHDKPQQNTTQQAL